MARKINFRPEVPSFLIVCEGKETEPNYFRAFHIGNVREVKAEGVGKSTVSLVMETIKLKSKGEYDQVWVVFDIDECKPAQVNDAIHMAEKNGIQVVYSNQAFELWYLLHFDYHNSSIDRKQYIQKLSKALECEYKKNAHDLYLRLFNCQWKALQNAQQLYASYEHPDPYHNDPCTTVFRLVEELNRYTRDSRR